MVFNFGLQIKLKMHFISVQFVEDLLKSILTVAVDGLLVWWPLLNDQKLHYCADTRSIKIIFVCSFCQCHGPMDQWTILSTIVSYI